MAHAYAIRLLEVLLAAGCDVHLTISSAAQSVIKQENNLNVDLEHFDPATLLLGAPGVHDAKLEQVRALAGISTESSNVLSVAIGEPGVLCYHHYRDYMRPWPADRS